MDKTGQEKTKPALCSPQKNNDTPFRGTGGYGLISRNTALAFPAIHIYYNTDHIIRTASFNASTHIIPPHQQVLILLSRETVQDMPPAVPEQYNIPFPEQFCFTGPQRHLILLIPEQRVHGVSFHPETYPPAPRQFFFRPGKEIFIRNPFHSLSRTK